MSHWYTFNGDPCHFIRGKAGSRPTTLRDARKLNLVPSVTTVLEVVAKPQLEQWKVRQGIMAALTLPRVDGEGEDEYLARIMRDSKQQAIDAADEGSRVHAAIEAAFAGNRYPSQYAPHVEGVMQALADAFPGVTDWISERRFASSHGFGGCCDLHSPSTGIVVDFKGKDGDFTDGKRLAYDQHWQLGAYQIGLELKRAPGANVFFSRTHPGKTSRHHWSEADMWAGWEVFSCALLLWQSIKGYAPTPARETA
jgi:hypothetical protein